MNSFELFEFQDYLQEEDFKKVEYIFMSQCIQKDFTEFNTSLGSNSKDYLSYLIASALIDGTIEDNKEGHIKFFSIANGFSERFFRNTVYHAYNLSVLNDKKELFYNLISTAKDYLKDGQFKAKDFKETQFRDYLHNIVIEDEFDPNFYELLEYQSHHKKLQSYLLQDKLNNELEVRDIHKKGNKI